MNSASILRILLPALVLGMSAMSCSIARTKVEVRSEPSGAEVSSLSGEVLGSTPLVISGDTLQKVSQDGKFFAIVSAPGHLGSQIVFDMHGEDVHQVKLRPLDSNYFTQNLLKNYQKQANEMARSLLQIQGLIAVKKLEEAERAIQDFQKLYPNIAASYVLLGNIELIRGNRGKAHGYLLRAQSIDPEDPVIARLVGNGTFNREPASSQPEKAGGAQ